MKYEPVIGLEIHAELKTQTKMFCYSKNDPDEKHPNINICPICMGHPGTLPYINKDAVKKVIQVGLALHAEIPEFSQFDRKNYFYPDLPKGYQISQYKYPLVLGGYLDIAPSTKRIRIERIHLEEDTGRLIHPALAGKSGVHAQGGPSAGSGRQASLVDFNRAGVPLMELVTEPDLRSSEEVREFGEELQKILQYLGASDANMEKGQMRVEVNISLIDTNTPRITQIPEDGKIDEYIRDLSERFVHIRDMGTKVEIKNINSFRYAADAADFEIKRQSALLDKGEKIAQETRGWNENKKETFSQRSKEEAHDYRYFPEPDLPPLTIHREWVEALRAELPELPQAKRARFEKEYGVPSEIAVFFAGDKALADYFEKTASELAGFMEKSGSASGNDAYKALASLVAGDFVRILRNASASASEIRITPENFAELVSYILENKISNTAAKQVLEEMFRSGDDPSDIIDRLGLWQVSDADDLEDIARHIVKENPKAAEDYKNGKEASLQFLVGQVMKESRGKANPKMVRDIALRILAE